MIVISDTSVISGLIKIRRLPLLKDVFSEIIIPPAAQSELEELKRFDYDLATLMGLIGFRFAPLAMAD